VDVVGTDGARTVTELADAGSASARIGILQRHVRSWTDGALDLHPSVDAMVHRLMSDPTCTVSELAREIGLSERQLLRRCTVTFGYGPATLRRILRLQRFLRIAGRASHPVKLTVLAAAAGYTDQQHLARDSRMIARATPGQLVDRVGAGRRAAASDPSTTPAADDGRLQGHRSQGGRR